jgi:hypothetical protein
LPNLGIYLPTGQQPIAHVADDAAPFNWKNTHMQTTTAANTDRVDQLEALGFTGEADYAEHQGVMQKMRDMAKQQLRDTRAAGGLELVHQSETGLMQAKVGPSPSIATCNRFAHQIA